MDLHSPPLTRWRETLPIRPYCTNDPACGLAILARERALRCLYVQFNPPGLIHWLLFDVDREDTALRWADVNLPRPTGIVLTPDSGRGHVIYKLALPVPTTEAARTHPIRYLAAVEGAFRLRLGADPGYGGLIAKNPLHPRWETLWLNRPYTLGELTHTLDPEELRQPVTRQGEVSGLGRNCRLFDELRYWAYAQVDAYRQSHHRQAWEAAVLTTALSLNVFQPPLPLSEVQSTARSVAKWVWTHYVGQGGRHRGVMALQDSGLDLRDKQVLAADRTNQIRRENTEANICQAIARLQAAGKRATKAAVARESGVSREEISKRYFHLFPTEKV